MGWEEEEKEMGGGVQMKEKHWERSTHGMAMDDSLHTSIYRAG